MSNRVGAKNPAAPQASGGSAEAVVELTTRRPDAPVVVSKPLKLVIADCSAGASWQD
jgi:hypothetical protein